MTTASAKLTAADLLTLPDAVNYELVDGNLVERHMGSESSAIAMAIGALLVAFVKSRHAEEYFHDCNQSRNRETVCGSGL